MDEADRRSLRTWYRKARRAMPWRSAPHCDDPYAIWVSEVMLQQTRVDVVVPYFLAWMRRFPTISSLAAASEDEVLAAWSGLGYYRRARSLHQAAKDHPDGLPTTAARLLEVKGIGPYTAAAVASIAHGEPVACVDGNVERVVRRVAGLRQESAAARRNVARLAQAWLHEDDPGQWNQAMMELGATVCLPRSPACGTCPVAASCAARRLGVQQDIPRPKAAARTRTVPARFALVVRRGRVLLVRPSGAGGTKRDGLLRGLWGLPGGVRSPDEPASRGAQRAATAGDEPWLAAQVLEQTGHAVAVHPASARLEHAFSHVTWDMRVHPAEPKAQAPGTPRRRRPRQGAAHESTWATIDDVRERRLPISTAARRAVLAGLEARA